MKLAIATLLYTALLLSRPGPPGGGWGDTATSATPRKPVDKQPPETAAVPDASSDLRIIVDKSAVVQHGITIRRVSMANSEIAEAVAVSSTEVLINGKAPGETSLILWDSKGYRTRFEVHVLANDVKIEAVRRELREELGDQDVSLTLEGNNVFLRGTVKEVNAADRAFAIASTLGKVVNLLRVLVPAGDPQILLKVRFANIDRTATSQLGLNLFSTGALRTIGNVTTGQFGQAPTFDFSKQPVQTTITNLLNIFFYRPDLNFGAMIQALEAKSLLQVLAEPNLLTISGRPASFLAGGEFPFPTLQGGAGGVGQITIQFKEFGIRLNFLPTVTPRGTINLVVTPEVSSLDYANGLTVSGFTIPGLDTRRVQTEVELQNGQSFVIAGLLDNQISETLNKIPGLSNIPLLGKLFQSRALAKNNTELLVMVTPELIGPIPVGTRLPEVKMDMPFLKGTAATAPQSPGPAITGPLPALPKRDSLPVEQLKSLTSPDNSSGNTPNNSTPGLGMPSVPPIQPGAQNPPPTSTQSTAAGPSH
ncbi:MAG: type II and III secretion system protein family protein [Bryobacteraceae bacterium]